MRDRQARTGDRPIAREDFERLAVLDQIAGDRALVALGCPWTTAQ